MKINERNVLSVFVSSNDKIMIMNEERHITQVKDIVRDFVENKANDPTKPEKEDTDIPDLGIYPVSKGVVSLQNDRGTSYKMYIMVQNELTRAFNELRDELSMDKFGVKFEDLSKELRNAVQKAIPLKISEAEPRNLEGN